MSLIQLRNRTNRVQKEKKKIIKKLTIPFCYELSEEERIQSLKLFKDLIDESYKNKKKRNIGIPEQMIFNYLRGAPLFKGINNVKKDNREIYSQWGWHEKGWEDLAINAEEKIVYQKFSRIIGYKYTNTLKCLKDAFSRNF